MAARWRIPVGGQSLRPAQRQPTANYRPAHNEIDSRVTQAPLPDALPLPDPVLPDPEPPEREPPGREPPEPEPPGREPPEPEPPDPGVPPDPEPFPVREPELLPDPDPELPEPDPPDPALPDPGLPPPPEPVPEPEPPLAELPGPVPAEPVLPPDPGEPDEPEDPGEPAEPVAELAGADPVPAAGLADDTADPEPWLAGASPDDPTAVVPGEESSRAASRPGTVPSRDARLPPDGVRPWFTTGAEVAGAGVTPPTAGPGPDDRGAAGST
jgi:hypothetical protein